MIIDNHAHVGVRKETDFDSYEDHMRNLQRLRYLRPREVRRVEDDSIVKDGRKTLWNESLSGNWQGRYDVDFKVKDERYIWEREGVKYYQPAATNVPQPASQLISLMDEVGIDKAVVQLPRNLNRYFSEIMHEYPDRFIALCQIEESEAYAKENIEKFRMYVKDWGLKGLYFDPLPGWDGWDNLYTEKYEPLWREVISLKIPIYSVCYSWNFEMFIKNHYKLLKKFPGITLVIVHGFPPKNLLQRKGIVKIPKIGVETVKNFDVYLELIVGRRPGDYGSHNEVIRCLYDTFGPSKLVWGSEFTKTRSPLAREYAKQLSYLEETCDYISKNDLRLILGENIQRIHE